MERNLADLSLPEAVCADQFLPQEGVVSSTPESYDDRMQRVETELKKLQQHYQDTIDQLSDSVRESSVPVRMIEMHCSLSMPILSNEKMKPFLSR